MDEGDRERLEHILEAITLAGNAEDVRAEIAELKQLAVQAKAVETSGVEAKLSRLKNLMQEQGFFDHPDQRLLLFTEFKDTLDYLVAKLVEWGFRVGSIHGSMRIGSRDDPGSRLHTEQQFRDGAIQILVATEAAGEGINLQCCNILFNYDIPWNPNRLEQRMGRIHRYGQTKNCLIFNFVATNTIEGRVLQRLLEKLQEIRNALNDDAVFNVVGEVLPAAQIERVLRDYYAGQPGRRRPRRPAAAQRGRGPVPSHLPERPGRAGLQAAQPGDADRAAGQGPGTPRHPRNHRPFPVRRGGVLVARPQGRAVAPAHLRSGPHADRPQELRAEPGLAAAVAPGEVSRGSPPHRETADANNLEWVTPGHPLFEAVRRHAVAFARRTGAGSLLLLAGCHAQTRVDFYRARMVDGLGDISTNACSPSRSTARDVPAIRVPGSSEI